MKHVGQYINLYKPVQHEVKLKVFIRYFNFNSSCQKLIFLSKLSLLHAIKLSPMCYLTVQAVISKLTTARAMELKGIKPIKICLHPPPEVEGRKKAPSLKPLTTRNLNTISTKSSVHKESTTVELATESHMLVLTEHVIFIKFFQITILQRSEFIDYESSAIFKKNRMVMQI